MGLDRLNCLVGMGICVGGAKSDLNDKQEGPVPNRKFINAKLSCGPCLPEDTAMLYRDDLPLPDLTPGAICRASRAIKQERRST